MIQPPQRRLLQKAAPRQPRQLAGLRDARQLSPTASGPADWQSPNWRRPATGRRARPAYRCASATNRAAAGRSCSRTRPWLPASAWGCRHSPGTPAGTCGNGRTDRPPPCTRPAPACLRATRRQASREPGWPWPAATPPPADSRGRSDTSARRATSTGTRRSRCKPWRPPPSPPALQANCNSNTRRGSTVLPRRNSIPNDHLPRRSRLRHRATTPAGRMCCVIRVGATGTIFPGFNRPCGSKICFNSRNTLTSGPYCLAKNGVRLRPSPCSPLIVPRSSHTFSYNSAGQLLHRAHVVRIRQIEKRANVQLSLRRVAEHRGRHLQPLERVLQMPQEDRQRLRSAPQCLRRTASAASNPAFDTTSARTAGPGPSTIENRPRPRRCTMRPPSPLVYWICSTRSSSLARSSSRLSAWYSTSSIASVSPGMRSSYRTSVSRARLKWRRSIKSHADGPTSRSPTPRAPPCPSFRTAAARSRDARAADRPSAWPR